MKYEKTITFIMLAFDMSFMNRSCQERKKSQIQFRTSKMNVTGELMHQEHIKIQKAENLPEDEISVNHFTII